MEMFFYLIGMIMFGVVLVGFSVAIAFRSIKQNRIDHNTRDLTSIEVGFIASIIGDTGTQKRKIFEEWDDKYGNIILSYLRKKRFPLKTESYEPDLLIKTKLLSVFTKIISQLEIVKNCIQTLDEKYSVSHLEIDDQAIENILQFRAQNLNYTEQNLFPFPVYIWIKQFIENKILNEIQDDDFSSISFIVDYWIILNYFGIEFVNAIENTLPESLIISHQRLGETISMVRSNYQQSIEIADEYLSKGDTQWVKVLEKKIYSKLLL